MGNRSSPTVKSVDRKKLEKRKWGGELESILDAAIGRSLRGDGLKMRDNVFAVTVWSDQRTFSTDVFRVTNRVTTEKNV